MVSSLLARPRRIQNSVLFNMKVDATLRDKAMEAALREHSDLSKEVRKFMERLVAESEAKHGPIVLPPSSSPS
jgi:hypothetical protein